MTTELTKTKGNIPATAGTEVENILGAAQQDAGFEKLLKFKKVQFLIGEDPVPSAPNTLPTLSAGPNAG